MRGWQRRAHRFGEITALRGRDSQRTIPSPNMDAYPGPGRYPLDPQDSGSIGRGFPTRSTQDTPHWNSYMAHHHYNYCHRHSHRHRHRHHHQHHQHHQPNHHLHRPSQSPDSRGPLYHNSHLAFMAPTPQSYGAESALTLGATVATTTAAPAEFGYLPAISQPYTSSSNMSWLPHAQPQPQGMAPATTTPIGYHGALLSTTGLDGHGGPLGQGARLSASDGHSITRQTSPFVQREQSPTTYDLKRRIYPSGQGFDQPRWRGYSEDRSSPDMSPASRGAAVVYTQGDGLDGAHVAAVTGPILLSQMEPHDYLYATSSPASAPATVSVPGYVSSTTGSPTDGMSPQQKYQHYQHHHHQGGSMLRSHSQPRFRSPDTILPSSTGASPINFRHGGGAVMGLAESAPSVGLVGASGVWPSREHSYPHLGSLHGVRSGLPQAGSIISSSPLGHYSTPLIPNARYPGDLLPAGAGGFNPPQNPSSSSSSSNTQAQAAVKSWDAAKPIIKQLYLNERRPLRDVMQTMESKYNFQATIKMYKTRITQWGFGKNNTQGQVKKLLAMKLQRDAEGKVTEFVRNGKVVDIDTYLRRKGVTEHDLVDFETAAELPEHVRCRTPTPPPQG